MMIFAKPSMLALSNESDVEQKFLFPLLVGDPPSALGHSAVDVHTKQNIRKFVIGKGSDQKSYFPDYVIARGGIPLAIAEAKAPGSNLDEAYREARLYAAELNARFPPGLQPTSRIIATDGANLFAGCTDHSDPIHRLTLAEIDVYSEKFVSLSTEFSALAIERAYRVLLPRIRPKRYWKPRKLVGGVSFQREEVGMNSFGATISADFSHIFNPLTLQDRTFIAKNAYISSKRRQRYIEPIDRVIRVSTPPSIARAKPIEDTATPVELVKKLRKGRALEHQVLLIIGSAGAGKSTFVDYIENVALPTDLIRKTIWLRLDMNAAPISRGEIYEWLRSEVIRGCRTACRDIDFDELETIKAVYAVEVNQFRKGLGRLYQSDKSVYNIKLAEHLEGIMRDKHLSAQNYAAYCSTNRQKLLVIVFDNCDKRLRDEQLLMFEAAQWIQREFRTLVVLPLREETYDNHQNEPPLDTALKDLVFRIEPPLFQKILQSRVQLAMRAARSNDTKMLRYELPNGMQVEYPASEQGHYLSSILRSVFEHDMHVRRLIVGLAGRNMRRAMEIFLDFCTSGHITEDHILKIVQSKGQYVLPLSLVTTVLLRSNLRFYDSDRAYLKNVYAASELDEKPSFFTRILILRWLDEQSNVFGPKRLKGYVQVGEIRRAMARFGVEHDVFVRELENLARGFCIMSEDFRTSELTDEDLVTIAPAGRVHLQICNDPYHLAAVAEDTWFDEEAMATAVAERVRDQNQQYLPRTALRNAKAALQMLERVYRTESAAYDAIFEDGKFKEQVNLQRVRSAVRNFENNLVSEPWASVPSRYATGKLYTGTVAAKKRYGVFVDLEPGVTGLLHSSQIVARTLESFRDGEKLRVKILDIDHLAKRIRVTVSAE